MKIPKRQSDILLKTFFKYKEFLESLTEEQKEDHFYLLKNTIMIFYNLTEEQYDTKPYTQLLSMYKIIENILNTPNDLVRIIKINKKKYGIQPDFSDMTFAELVDCDTDDVVRQMAILYRPITKKFGNKYQIEKYTANIEHYDFMKENLTLDVYTGFIAFFLKIQKSFTTSTLKSLKEMATSPEMKNSLEKSGAGLVGSLNYVEEILRIKIPSLK